MSKNTYFYMAFIAVIFLILYFIISGSSPKQTINNNPVITNTTFIHKDYIFNRFYQQSILSESQDLNKLNTISLNIKKLKEKKQDKLKKAALLKSGDNKFYGYTRGQNLTDEDIINITTRHFKKTANYIPKMQDRNLNYQWSKKDYI